MLVTSIFSFSQNVFKRYSSSGSLLSMIVWERTNILVKLTIGILHFQLSAALAVVWCSSVLLYLFSGYLHISGYIFPLSLAGLMLLFLINPIPIFHHSSRMWLLKILVSLEYCSVSFFLYNIYSCYLI